MVIAFLLSAVAGAAEGGDVLAEVEGKAIRADEVEAALSPQLGKLYEQVYELKRKKLEDLIMAELLNQEAVRRSLSVPQLLDAEVTSKVPRVTESEVDDQYTQKRPLVRGPAQVVRERIRSALHAERVAAQKEAFLRRLRAERHVVVHLQPPAPAPVPVKVSGREGAAVKGSPTASVVIVEFSDFQCPFCKRGVGEVNKVLAAYPREVQLVYRHFPIDGLHPLARMAAQAAECAGVKGRFWEYHDRLFEQGDVSLPRLKELAEGLGLDLPAFEGCLTGEWARTRVTQDVEAGTRVGVSATPTFFINGRMLVGAQPFEAFKPIIEQELARHPSQSVEKN